MVQLRLHTLPWLWWLIMLSHRHTDGALDTTRSLSSSLIPEAISSQWYHEAPTTATTHPRRPGRCLQAMTTQSSMTQTSFSGMRLKNGKPRKPRDVTVLTVSFEALPHLLQHHFCHATRRSTPTPRCGSEPAQSRRLCCRSSPPRQYGTDRPAPCGVIRDLGAARELFRHL